MLKKGFRFIGLFMLTAVLLSLVWVIAYKYFNPPVSTLMIYKYLHEENYTVKNSWVSLEEISPAIPLAIIASEDQLFLKHQGFDIVAIQKAIETNKTSRRVVGASTISQQVAKNVFLIPSRNFLRKGVEAYFTVLIEALWGKKRILEVYLNIIELGPGIYGVEEACSHYFKIQASHANWNDAALMAVALPNPIVYSLKKPSPYMYRRKNWVLKQMENLGGERLLNSWYE